MQSQIDARVAINGCPCTNENTEPAFAEQEHQKER